MEDLPLKEKKYFKYISVILFALAMIDPIHRELLNVERYFGVWNLFEWNQVSRFTFFVVALVISMIFYIMSFYKWTENKLKSGLKAKKIVDSFGLKFFVENNIDMSFIFVFLSFVFYIKSSDGSVSEFRLITYIFFIILMIVYLKDRKDLYEYYKTKDKASEFLEKENRYMSITVEDIKCTAERLIEAIRIFKEIENREGRDFILNEDLLRLKYPSEVEKALALMNHNINKDVEVMRSSLSSFMFLLDIREMKRHEYIKIFLLSLMMLSLLIFILSYLFF